MAASSVVAGHGPFLVEAAPGRPVQPVGDRADGTGDQFREEVADFVDGQRDQLVGACGALSAFPRGDDGEDGVGEHDQRGVAIPGLPGADLVLVEADLGLGGLETFLDAPPGAGYPDQRGQADRLGGVAAVEGQPAVTDALAYQQPMVAGRLVGWRDDLYPVPVSSSLGCRAWPHDRCSGNALNCRRSCGLARWARGVGDGRRYCLRRARPGSDRALVSPTDFTGVIAVAGRGGLPGLA